MTRVVLQERTGRQIIFEQEDLSQLKADEIERLTLGEEIQWKRKTFRLKSQLGDGTWLYTEHGSWMDKHPLVQLDLQLRDRRRTSR